MNRVILSKEGIRETLHNTFHTSAELRWEVVAEEKHSHTLALR
jgi:hypothetical protein